jgi:hypothetical protein
MSSSHRVSIAKDGQIFWSSQWVSEGRAEDIRRKNQRLIDKHGWNHVVSIEAIMSPEGQQTLKLYADRGWFDAANDPRLRDDDSPWEFPRPAYLVIASGNVLVRPASGVQVTARCNYRAFRGRCLVVMSEAATRFDLLDLKVGFRSQFCKDEPLPLRGCVGEATPAPIQWPLETCKARSEISLHAVIPVSGAEGDADPGAVFEVILLGEVL